MFQSLPSTISQSGKLHTTPSSDEEAEQVLPVPIEDVHGLFSEQVVILATVPLVSIGVFELIMMIETSVDI